MRFRPFPRIQWQTTKRWPTITGGRYLDISAVQCEQARRRWGHLPGARFVQGEAVEFLARTGDRWHAIYSIWGAAWFTDPDRLLPLVRDRLTAGGRRQVWAYRWAYEPEAWAEVVRRHGFGTVRAWHEPAPDPENVGTLIVEAQR